MDFGRIGKYTVIGKIGQGAVGEVFRAHDPGLNREVAIKMNASAIIADAEVKQRFLREAQSAALLNHPNIVTVYDFGEEHDRVYMAMELLEGTDLRNLIETDALGELDDKLDVMEQICDGVAFAHANGVIHRDLKPANIHIQTDRTVRIIDFGLARLRSGEMTTSGMVLGTPHYMSPEQVQGQRADARSDVFSLGAVFYELLTRHRPFAADSLHGILFRVVNTEPEPLRQWAPDVPEVLVQFVEKAMAKDQEERFQDGAELRQALQAVRAALSSGTDEASLTLPDFTVRSKTPATPPPARDDRRSPSSAMDTTRQMPRPAARRQPPPPSRTRALPYVGGALAVVALIVGASFWMRAGPAAQRATPAPDAAQQQVRALTEALVENQVEMAGKRLLERNYGAALAQAERALRLDPASVRAAQIAAEARRTLDQVAAAAAEARSAAAAGDDARAAQALFKVLSLDPGNAVAEELAGRLNTRSRPQADAARKAMDDSRAQAVQAKATSLDSFTAAAALSRDGDAMVKRGQFATGARAFLLSRDGFDRARREAGR